MAGQVLDVFECDSLCQQIGDARHAETMRREMDRKVCVFQPAFDHAAKVDISERP